MPYATAGGISRADMSSDPAWVEITDEQYAQALDGMAAGKLVSIDGGFAVVDPPKPEEPSEPEPVEPGPPLAVSAAQGGIALIRAGLMDDVQAAADAPDTPPEIKWAWSKATVWERNSPAFNYLADKAGITDAQKDALFVDAAQIVP